MIITCYLLRWNAPTQADIWTDGLLIYHLLECRVFLATADDDKPGLRTFIEDMVEGID